MKKLFFIFLIFTCISVARGQEKTDKSEFNFDLENVILNEDLPQDWFKWGRDYNFCVDTVIKHRGKYSVLIQPSDAATDKSFGCATYKVPAIYEGKSIEVRAYMKMENVNNGPIGLLLRIDGRSDMLQFDNMQKKNIQGSSDWKKYSVKLPYPKNAKTIYIGGIHSGLGKLWVDDFKILIDGKDIKKAKLRENKVSEFENSSNVKEFIHTEEKVNDLKVVGLVWGFLKYYHPNVAKGDYNWDYELFKILPQIIDAKTSSERDNILTNWIKSLGEFKVAKNKKKKSKDVKFNPDLEWINNSGLSEDLVSQLTDVKNAVRVNKNCYVDLAKYIGNPKFDSEERYSDMKYPDTGYRLLSLYRYWNIIQYYFPYKNLIEEDWKDVLKEFIPKYLNASSEIDYKLSVLELIGRIHDTHANIWGYDKAIYEYKGLLYAPVEIKFIENRAIIIDFYNEEFANKADLQIGDEIKSINNKPVDDIVKERLKYTPASNYPTKLRNIAGNLLRTNDTILNIELVRNNEVELKKTKTYNVNTLDIYKRNCPKDTCFKMINSDIGYIYPGTIKRDYLPEIIKETQNTKGLIIDFRCYPSDNLVYELGRYLMPKPTEFVKFTKGSINTPGLFKHMATVKVGRKNKDYYKGKVVIIIDESTQSQAEYTTMAFRVAPQATVIGSTTAGADGNVSDIYLPGGIRTMISGIGVYNPDGSETQRIGIVPDIEIKPTVEGVRQNKDELLEKAIEIINE